MAALKHIETQADYAEYQKRVADFFTREGITNLSAIPDKDGDSHPYFSWRPCDCCGRPLGGDREDCNGYNPTTKQVQDGYAVCVDCLYYAEYGTLDDQTMLDLKA